MVQSSVYLGALLAALPSAYAGFNASSTQNIAVYWGQNSANQADSQQRLSTYCANAEIDIIPIGFLNGISPVITNFANAGNNCTAFADNKNALNCPQIEQDIITCQQTYGKTILISLGGGSYTQGGFSSTDVATSAAQTVWNMFGPVNPNSNVDRPFGSAVVDGVDFDFESGVNNLEPFAAELRSLMDASASSANRKFYLSAAPQCVYPDYADNPALNGSVFFDFIMIQYYNNGCGVSSYVPGASTQWNYNFDVWDNWAHTVSKNPNVRILLGIAANTGAASGYVSGTQLSAVISFTKQYSSFAGIMMWDMSQLYENSGFLDQVVSDLGASGSTPPPTSSSGGSKPTSTSGSTGPTGGGGGGSVPQWGQCGGQGYTGPTQCQSPYTCVASSTWWSSCQ
ncbi:glycosylhydrolase family 18-1 [Trichoderma gamsii]|uniref:chitinase n=1 Tax=Trichoderma gamsii TaxID=398673 RepID=A0A2P4ZC91_9HYPO|nr:glycosylhydrolase family 18-1 [Trichoderma gamsii]PON21914.1 glycosylhydrolase family 18-1 [Trichoderma gamsii]